MKSIARTFYIKGHRSFLPAINSINSSYLSNRNTSFDNWKKQCDIPKFRHFFSSHQKDDERKFIPSRFQSSPRISNFSPREIDNCTLQSIRLVSTKKSETSENGKTVSNAFSKKRTNIHFHTSSLSSMPNNESNTSPKGVKREALQTPAGPLYNKDDRNTSMYIPQVALHDHDGRRRKRILVLCTGGTLTMKPDPYHPDGALTPMEGSLTEYMSNMTELQNENMPEVVAHEYTPLLDSADLGPAEWAVLAEDIKSNYYHFDGFVVLMGTDTMAYTATAMSFMLENLNKAVVFTGSQIPLNEPYNDARRNLIMALIFASRETICEVSIFFHDRLLRACRATKVNTHRLLAFDSPNMDPLATIGITIDENESLLMPSAKGALRVHTDMETKILSLRLVPGYDDEVIRHMIDSATETNLKAIILQLYGTGNLPSIKSRIIQCLQDATEKGILVVASTQCFTGSVMMGHYATGRALKEVGVVSAADMTLEAISCKLGYLFGRGDLTVEQVGSLLPVSLRGEVTPAEALSPPPLSSAFQRASRKGKKYY